MHSSWDPASKDWETKYHALATACDSMRTAIDTNDGKLVSVQADLDLWKAKCLAAAADVKTTKDERDAKLKIIQAEVDGWRTNYFDALRTATDERGKTLAMAQSEVDAWKVRSLTADNERDSAQRALLDVRAELAEQANATQTELAQWTAKATAWDAERNRHKIQAACNATLISQLQSNFPNLESKLRNADTELERLKTALQESNAQNNALVTALEELKKRDSAAARYPKVSPMFISREWSSMRGLALSADVFFFFFVQRSRRLRIPRTSLHHRRPLAAVRRHVDFPDEH